MGNGVTQNILGQDLLLTNNSNYIQYSASTQNIFHNIRITNIIFNILQVLKTYSTILEQQTLYSIFCKYSKHIPQY